MCFLVDCTSSMCSHIEAVKNNVQNLRDHLATEYKGCDLRFAFVRYTDYDQPESSRTTWLNFTRYLYSVDSVSILMTLRVYTLDDTSCANACFSTVMHTHFDRLLVVFVVLEVEMDLRT